MNEAEFDKFADEYYAMHAASITASGEGPAFFAEYKVRDLAHECRRFQLDSKGLRVLDFGAGSGNSVPYVAQHLPGASLTCLDVSARSLALAEARFPGSARYVRFEGNGLPFDEGSFDVVFAACVFHHIEPGDHLRLLLEWRRVLRPGGLAMIYEHNPLNPLTRRVVNSCPFDVNAQLIRAGNMRRRLAEAGLSGTQIRFRVFFPHVLRALRPFESLLGRLPVGAQYYAVARR